MGGSNAGSPPARVGCEGLDATAPAYHERRGSPGPTGDERRDLFVEGTPPFAGMTAELARSPTATDIAQHAMIAGVPFAWPDGGSDCSRLGNAVERTAAATVVRFSGEVDRDHAEQVRHAVVRAALSPGTARRSIELARVRLVDTAGLAALRTAADAAARAGVDLRLATGQPFVRRVVARSRLGSRVVCR